MRSSVSVVFATTCLATLIAGCSDDPSPSTDEQLDPATVATGIDYAWSHPPPSQIQAEGYSFAARYLSYDTTGKSLTPGEAQALWGAGVDIVVVWEQTANAALSGYGRGVSDANAAVSQANADGMPSGRPIYFAVDFDATAAQQGALNDYFSGVASVIGVERTGVYGGYYVVQRLFDAGKVQWGWQTYAWSGGHWEERAQLRQTLNSITVAGLAACCDRDQAVAADYGQWHAEPVDSHGCTMTETSNAGQFGCTCVNHLANGGYCDGTGCTATETSNAAFFGCTCVDHLANGGYCPGTGCTARETLNAAQFGCTCVDHAANGGYCPGTGCTALETQNAAQFGCTCVDHVANGGYCPGTGCTALETQNAAQFGCGCVDHHAAGGACPGTGCTAKETNDCTAHGLLCVLHQCTTRFPLDGVKSPAGLFSTGGGG